jgi:hypothetical protein
MKKRKNSGNYYFPLDFLSSESSFMHHHFCTGGILGTLEEQSIGELGWNQLAQPATVFDPDNKSICSD